MGKKNNRKSKFQNKAVNLADLREQAIVEPVSSYVPGTDVISFIKAQLLATPEAQNVMKALAAKAEIAEKETLKRAFEREKSELETKLSMLNREKAGLENVAGHNVEAVRNLKAVAKDKLKKDQDLSRLWGTLDKSFHQMVDAIIKQGLASDARYQELEAEGLNLMKNAEKLAREISRTEKAIAAQTRKINRLDAEVAKLDAVANSI